MSYEISLTTNEEAFLALAQANVEEGLLDQDHLMVVAMRIASGNGDMLEVSKDGTTLSIMPIEAAGDEVRILMTASAPDAGGSRAWFYDIEYHKALTYFILRQLNSILVQMEFKRNSPIHTAFVDVVAKAGNECYKSPIIGKLSEDTYLLTTVLKDPDNPFGLPSDEWQ